MIKVAKKCLIKMIWDDESESWYCTSDDIPGLVLGADTFDELVLRVCDIAPELLEDNLNYKGSVQLIFVTERIEILDEVS